MVESDFEDLSDCVNLMGNQREAFVLRKLGNCNSFLSETERQESFISLEEYLKGSSLDRNTFFQIFINISMKIQEIHEKLFIHLNITPNTIYINPSSKEIKISNFEYAVYWREAITSGPHLLSYSIKKRNFHYLSPEQCLAKSKIDYRSDLYNIGLVMFRALTKETPFSHFKTKEQLIIAHTEILPIITKHDRKWDTHILEKIILKLLDKKPENRYQTCASLCFDLENYDRIQIRKKVRLLNDISSSSICRSLNASTETYENSNSFRSFRYKSESCLPFASKNSGVCKATFNSLGSQKYRNFLKHTTKVFGFDQYASEVVEQYREVANSKKSSLVLIKGASGLGKSTL